MTLKRPIISVRWAASGAVLALLLSIGLPVRAQSSPAEPPRAKQGSSAVTKQQVIRMLTRDGLTESDVLWIADKHFASGGEAFRLSFTEMQNLRQQGVSNETLYMLQFGRPPTVAELAALSEVLDLHRSKSPPKPLPKLLKVNSLKTKGTEPKRLNARFLLLDTSLVASGGEGGATVEGDLTLGLGFMVMPDLYVCPALGTTSYGADDVAFRLLGRVGALVDLDDERTSFLDLRVSAGWRIGEVVAGLIDVGLGVLVAFGESSGGLLRFGVDLTFVSADDALTYSFAPIMGFGGHF